MTTYKDANLYHDLMTGHAVTGVLHFVKQTPSDSYTKKQETVKTATYGSEFAVARTAIQQIAGLRQALQYLGVPIRESCYLFRDNESVIKSSTVPRSQLSKRHHALAYHFTHEAVASKMVIFTTSWGRLIRPTSSANTGDVARFIQLSDHSSSTEETPLT